MMCLVSGRILLSTTGGSSRQQGGNYATIDNDRILTSINSTNAKV